MKIFDALDLAIEALVNTAGDNDNGNEKNDMAAVAALRSLRDIISQVKSA